MRNFFFVDFILVLALPDVNKNLLPLVQNKSDLLRLRLRKILMCNPNGQSAMWAKTENATKTTIIMWENVKLHTTGNSNNVTALVPKELYSKKGQFHLYLIDAKTGAKSNTLEVVVK